ncbi:MAG TPA: AAA family ATPase [Acidimicrobiales bacterium]
MRQGQIIILNGTSSSGKTSIAEQLLVQLDRPYFYIPFDAINAMRSRSRTKELDPLDLKTVLERTRLGHLGAVAGMARAGNDVIMDEVLRDRSWLLDSLKLFEPFDVVFVGIRCSLSEVERREGLRGDRSEGQAARQFTHVHDHGLYDVECDSELSSPAECATKIVSFLATGGDNRAFTELRETLL